MRLLFIILLCVFTWSCKKDTKTPQGQSNCITNCNYYSILTSHKWLAIHYYEDSTTVAYNSPLSLPLSSTYDYFDPQDTCGNESKLWLRSDGHKLTIYSPKCLSNPGDTIDESLWTLTGSNNDRLNLGGGPFNIIKLNNDTLVLHYISEHVSQGDTTLYTELWVMIPDN